MLCIVGNALVQVAADTLNSSGHEKSVEGNCKAQDAESENLHLERVIGVYPHSIITPSDGCLC